MNFKPFGDRLVIRPDDKIDAIQGYQLIGSDIVETAQGRVMAVGTGVALHNIVLNITGEVSETNLLRLESIVRLIKEGREILYKVGDHVLYGKYAGTRVPIEGEEYLIMREVDCFGVVPDENTGEADY